MNVLEEQRPLLSWQDRVRRIGATVVEAALPASSRLMGWVVKTWIELDEQEHATVWSRYGTLLLNTSKADLFRTMEFMNRQMQLSARHNKTDLNAHEVRLVRNLAGDLLAAQADCREELGHSEFWSIYR